jgi:hypothetical protein
MGETFQVGGNHGVLTVATATGEVLEQTGCMDSLCDCGEGYPLVRIDVEEWTHTYGHEPCGYVDVLDVGGWTASGEYVEPEEDYRADLMQWQDEQSNPNQN